ncbi:MAG: hypothetical protein ACE5G0_18300 [Rhodothermales bacterium]
MPLDPSTSKKPALNEDDAKLSKTVLEDLKRGDFQRSFNQDLRDIYQFYLDKKTRDELAQMGQFNRWVYLTSWLLKSSFLKLPPSRRLLLLAGLFFFLHGVLGFTASFVIGFITVLFVLLLELKDKLLAQDELETGRAVQLALMPTEHPSIPGWETWLYTSPANEVGGIWSII